MSVSSNVPGNQSDGLHQLIKKMAQLAPQNKGCQKLSESSAKHQNQEKADLRRLEDLVILLYEGYTPYSGHIPECKCKGVDSGNCVLQVMKAFLTVGGRNVIVEILRNGGNSVVEWAMKIAWRIYNSRNLLLKCKGEFDESAAKLPLSSTIGNLSATSKKIQFKINPREYEFESLVISTLQSRKILPVRAVVVLFEIIVGDLRMPGKLRTDVYMVPISEFQLIPIILTKFDNFSVSGLKSALESLNVLLLNTKINLEIMYRQQSWQKWLVPFLLSNSSKQMSGKITSEQISPEDELEIFKFTANLFTMIHYHCFKTKKLGFKQLFKDTKSALVQRFGWVSFPF